MTSRSSANQSSREAIDEGKRERGVCAGRVCWTASCEHFFGTRLLSMLGRAIRFQLTIHLLARSRIRELGKYVTRKRRHVLITYARDCVASFTRADNFFCSLAIARSLHAGGVAKWLPGVTENFNLCVLLDVLLSVVYDQPGDNFLLMKISKKIVCCTS